MKKRLEDILLTRGTHASADEGLCAMEAVAWLGGEPHSDHPRSACPVLASFMRAWNDNIEDDAERTRLFAPLLPKLVDSIAGKGVEERRAHLALDWLIRTHAAEWLAVRADLVRHSEALKALPSIESVDTAEAASRIVRAAARDSAIAWDAAHHAALGPVRIVARLVGNEAVKDAVVEGIWTAAWTYAQPATVLAADVSLDDGLPDSARAAAIAGALSAAKNAAWVLAWTPAQRGGEPEARATLRPIRERLVDSAVTLFDRMLSTR